MVGRECHTPLLTETIQKNPCDYKGHTHTPVEAHKPTHWQFPRQTSPDVLSTYLSCTPPLKSSFPRKGRRTGKGHTRKEKVTLVKTIPAFLLLAIRMQRTHTSIQKHMPADSQLTESVEFLVRQHVKRCSLALLFNAKASHFSVYPPQILPVSMQDWPRSLPHVRCW